MNVVTALEWTFFVLLSALLLLAAMMDTAAAEQTQGSDSAWQWTLQAGAVYQSSASLDAGGDMSATRVFVSAGTARVFACRWRVGAALGYGEDDYGAWFKKG